VVNKDLPVRTVADLVADYRAATPTGAIVALLPDRSSTNTSAKSPPVRSAARP
jgi:exonuclease VII large subunit